MARSPQTPSNGDINSELHNLIAAPLIGLVRAEAAAAQATLDIIKQVGFDGDNQPRMLDFSYESPNGGEQQVSLPLLTLIPLPVLQVSSGKFEYQLQPVSLEGGAPMDDSPSQDGPGATTRPPPTLRARMLADSSQSQDPSSTIKVTIETRASDLPAGINKLLAVLSQAVSGSSKTPSASDQSPHHRQEKQHDDKHDPTPDPTAKTRR